MPHSVVSLVSGGRPGGRILGPGAGDVEVDLTPPAAECLFLSGLAGHRRMPVLGTRLMREEDQFLRADSIRVHINNDLQSRLLELAQAEIRYFDIPGFIRPQHDPGLI